LVFFAKEHINKTGSQLSLTNASYAYILETPLGFFKERRVKRVSRNGGCAGEDRVCGSSGHCTGLFGSRFQGPSLLTGPPPFSFLSLCAVYPATLRLAASPPHFVILRGSSILALLASDLSSVSLVRARIAALCRDILSVLFWRTSGGWHADKENLLAQEILLQEARGWLTHAVRLIYLLLVSDVECL